MQDGAHSGWRYFRLTVRAGVHSAPLGKSAVAEIWQNRATRPISPRGQFQDPRILHLHDAQSHSCGYGVLGIWTVSGVLE